MGHVTHISPPCACGGVDDSESAEGTTYQRQQQPQQQTITVHALTHRSHTHLHKCGRAAIAHELGVCDGRQASC